MRSFTEYIIYFRGNKEYSNLVNVLEQDTDLPEDKSPIILLRYFVHSAKYMDYHEHLQILYTKYAKTLGLENVHINELIYQG